VGVQSGDESEAHVCWAGGQRHISRRPTSVGDPLEP
jgi:hypothetical protein